jgi:hypothetical protein
MAGWTFVENSSAVAADAVTLLTHGYRRQHVFRADRTLKFVEKVLRKCVHSLVPGDRNTNQNLGLEGEERKSHKTSVIFTTARRYDEKQSLQSGNPGQIIII